MPNNLIVYLLIAPFIGFLINGLFGRSLKSISGWIASFAVLISFVLSIVAFQNIGEHGEISVLYEWIKSGDLSVSIGFQIDQLSGVMLLVITGVGFLIHVYSIGYMSHDNGITRYFAYLNLFIFAMLILVTANNYLMMFIGWEGVGLCSYLLIGFWFEKKSATDAGKKAFIVNRIGDFGFLLGMFTLFAAFRSLNFSDILDLHVLETVDTNTLKLASLLLFVGAIGKSAQIPLYVWLPDAMEGPTPVSALIHAATMVTAGVYMIARSALIFDLAGTGSVVAWIGVFTAFFAATMAITENDIKRILAYSTISQLGYMFVGVGVGAYASGIFHLMTHAFFKGLMFLAAGSVMHAMSNELDMRKMGGLRSKLPITYWTFLIGALAISGFPLMSGFWSKDEILHAAWEFSKPIYVIGLITAFLTAFYMFRLIFVTFHGKSRVDPNVASHLHESPPIMTLPLILLAIPSAVIGMIVGWGGHDSIFHKFLVIGSHGEKSVSHSDALVFMIVSSIVGLAGIAVAWMIYSKRSPKDLPESLIEKLLAKKYYIDEIYNAVIVQPIKLTSDYILSKLMDVLIVDGLFVTGTAFGIRGIGRLIGKMQTGIVPTYVFTIILGIVLFLGYLFVS